MTAIAEILDVGVLRIQALVREIGAASEELRSLLGNAESEVLAAAGEAFDAQAEGLDPTLLDRLEDLNLQSDPVRVGEAREWVGWALSHLYNLKSLTYLAASSPRALAASGQ